MYINFPKIIKIRQVLTFITDQNPELQIDALSEFGYEKVFQKKYNL